jgi:hypothetical protein
MLESCREMLRRRSVVILCDNEPLVHTLSTMTSKLAHGRALIYTVALFALTTNSHLSFRFVPRQQNSRADHLSKGRVDQFKSECRAASLPAHPHPHPLAPPSKVRVWPRTSKIF